MVEPYPTPETSLAAYLIQSGFPLKEITYEMRSSGKRQATFLFADTPQLHESINLFEQGKAVINLVLYEHTRSSLLDKIMRGQQ